MWIEFWQPSFPTRFECQALPEPGLGFLRGSEQAFAAEAKKNASDMFHMTIRKGPYVPFGHFGGLKYQLRVSILQVDALYTAQTCVPRPRICLKQKAAVNQQIQHDVPARLRASHCGTVDAGDAGGPLTLKARGESSRETPSGRTGLRQRSRQLETLG